MATHQWTLDCVSYQLALQRLQYYVNTKEGRKREAVKGKKRHERCEERQKEYKHKDFFRVARMSVVW